VVVVAVRRRRRRRRHHHLLLLQVMVNLIKGLLIEWCPLLAAEFEKLC
jgi:hypothetical protein